MSERDAIDMIMTVAADPSVWDPADDAWLASNRAARRDRAKTVAAAIRSALKERGYEITPCAPSPNP